MKYRIGRLLVLALAIATPGQANQFIGDLVFCDDNANGHYDEGERPLDDVVVNLTCWHVLDEDAGIREACVDASLPGWDNGTTSVVTGEIHESILDGYQAFNESCSAEAGYDPTSAADREGRYIVRVPNCTIPYRTDRIECEVDVDEAASAAALGSCNVQVTPLEAVRPVDGNDDGLFCDLSTDGPFPEDQELGNLAQYGGCHQLPDLAPMDGVYRPVIQYGGDLCSLNNDFGYTNGGNPPVCDLGVEKSCLVLPPPSSGDQCEGKVRRAVFQYTGDDCDALDNTQEGKAKCTGGLPGASADVVVTKDADKIFATPNAVALGGTFEIVKREKGQLKDFPSEIEFDLRGDATQSFVLHTSCSKPLSVGDRFGGVRLVELETTEGGVQTLGPDPTDLLGGFKSCEIPAPGAVECEEKPTQISFRYVGGECSVSNSQEGKASCDGVSAGADPVRLLFTDKDGKHASHDGEVGLGDVVVVTNEALDDSDSDKFSSDSRIQLFDGNRLLQTIKLHTSCSKPLRLGDRFGALEVVGFVDPKLGSVQSGADVLYFWEIDNRGSALTNVTLRDAQLDPPDVPGTPLMSMEAESTLFFREVIRVDGPVSAAEGEVVVEGVNASGDVCRDTDTLRISVTEPPPEPFVCSDAKPIHSLSLIWTGPSGVDVVSESGQRIDDVMNGHEITLDVLGLGNDVDIALSGSVSGNSRFHVSCSDQDMNGPEDCGTLQGNSKNDDSSLRNLWSFQGMAGDLSLDCRYYQP